MKGIGTEIVHKRYGKGIVTHKWYKIINPVDRTSVLCGLTFKLLTAKGRELFNKDRSFNGTLTSTPLVRCYEGNLSLIDIADHETS